MPGAAIIITSWTAQNPAGPPNTNTKDKPEWLPPQAWATCWLINRANICQHPGTVNAIANEMQHITLPPSVHKTPHTSLANAKCRELAAHMVQGSAPKNMQLITNPIGQRKPNSSVQLAF